MIERLQLFSHLARQADTKQDFAHGLCAENNSLLLSHVNAELLQGGARVLFDKALKGK